MGGPCRVSHQNSFTGVCKLVDAPDCTDNFQIVEGRFRYADHEWHSVEQAFQSLKFPLRSIAQEEIFFETPLRNESSESYGHRMWGLGQPRRDTSIREDWQDQKVKIMLLLNLAKYSSKQEYQSDILRTGTTRIIAQNSTAMWPFWNGAIQTYIRKKLQEEIDLKQHINDIEIMPPKEVEDAIMDSYTFNAREDSYREYRNSSFEFAMELYNDDPPQEIEQTPSKNKPIPLWKGKLILSGVSDFTAAFQDNVPDVVVTMCSKPPIFPEGASGGKWMHRCFDGFDLMNFEVIGSIVYEITKQLEAGRTVLLHCLDGQDRTGIVALTILRLHYGTKQYSTFRDILTEARPEREDYWFNTEKYMVERSNYNYISKVLFRQMRGFFEHLTI